MTVPAHLPWARKYPASVDWAAEIAPKPLHALFDEAVAKYGAHDFLDFLGRKYSYAQIAAMVGCAARGLSDLGVSKGDRVGLLLPNSPYYVIAYFAILKIGAVVVNFNPLYAEREIAHQANDAGISVLITIDVKAVCAKLQNIEIAGLRKIIVGKMADILPWPLSWLYPWVKRNDIAPLPQEKRYMDFADLLKNDGVFVAPPIDPLRDLAVLQYTGGTTGVPKGAMLTHANLLVNAIQSRMIFPRLQEGREVMLGVIPFFHVFAMTAVMNVTIAMGGKILLLPRFDLMQVVRIIHKKRPTLFPAVPTIYTAINHCKSLGEYDLSSIKYCFSGGAPLPIEVKRDFERLTGCVLVEGYGLSETSPVATVNPIEGENKTGSIGLPVAGTYIEIISLDDGVTKMPIGEKGEVCIRGPQVMAGYWQMQSETDNVLKQTPEGPRLHTGDVGYMDEDGYTFIVDRIKDMIAAGGFKVYPRHVEEAIYLHEAVEECIVAGVPDEYRGQTVKAFIKLKDGRDLSREQLLVFLKDKLSPIEMPKQVEFREKPLPKTMIGKLSRKLVLEEEAAAKN